MRNIWKDGIFGVVVGDALGCPVQFESREKVAEHPVTGRCGERMFYSNRVRFEADKEATGKCDAVNKYGSLEELMYDLV